ncbi:MAG: hypothetical protein LDLANPLL_02409 [Turneriella sp.]|nr:hypothetical protein [Turneriella sp.]
MRTSAGIQSELDLINQVFGEDDSNEENVIALADALFKSGETNIYARLLHILCHLRLDANEAKSTWHDILNHRDFLESKLGRGTGFRVAMVDYFVNKSHELKNPKVIEIRVYAETARQAAIDELTGIFNRRFFDAALEREIKQALRRNRQFSLLILDIDNFKKINDTHGHTTGDAVISALGKLLREIIRAEDTPCRIGGEEFAVIFPETDAKGAMVVSEKIRSEFAKLKIAGTELSLCGGLTTFPEDGKSAHELLERADQMLYFAKYSGKNRIICYSQNKRRTARYPVKWEFEVIQKGKALKGKSVDISVDGISFELDTKTKPGDRFDLTLHIDGELVELPVEIIWVDANTKSHKLRAGARFLTPKPYSISILKKKLPQ